MANNRSSGWTKWIIILIVIGLIIAAGDWYFRSKHETGPQFQTAPVTRGELTQLVTATGTLNPVTNVQVGCQVSGTINKIYVDYNSPVKEGEVIAEIDPRSYQAQANQAQADLANAKANLELQQVEANRSSELYTNKLISESDYDTAIASLHEAQAMVEIKEASMSNALANLGYCKIYSPVDGIVISRAVDVGQTVAASFNTPTLFQIANDLTKMQIDTSVAEADVGNVQEGQRVEFTVDAYPYRTFYGSVTQVRNSPTTQNNVVTYDCVIDVNNADYKLKPGMTANVSIIVAQRENALEIPNGALRFRLPDELTPPPSSPPATNAINTTNNFATGGTRNFGSGGTNRFRGFGGGRFGGFGGMRGRNAERQMFRTVYVLTGQGDDAKLKAVQIKVGITDGIDTEVLSGLNEGDQVVTGMAFASQDSGPGNNPFGGGFPRFRRR